MYAYCVIAFNNEGRGACLAGIYLDKQKAMEDLLRDGQRIFEYYYGVVAIEKYALDSLGHPSLVARDDREELLWFIWHNEKQAYVAAACPEWGERTSGFV